MRAAEPKAAQSDGKHGEKTSGWSELTAINWAKALTVGLLILLAVRFGLPGTRQVLYLSLHICYCLWWLLEQWLFPARAQQLFTERVGAGRFVMALLFIGVLYSLPGWMAFLNPVPISNGVVALGVGLFSFGSLINATADVQKMTAKAMGAGLVADGIWRQVRHVNYLGDLLRYLSFAVVAGMGWAYLVPALVLLIYLQRIQEKEQHMAAKYPEFAAYQTRSTRLLPWIW